MLTAVKGNLPTPDAPLNWAVKAPASEVLYTVHLSIGPDGAFVDGTIEEQTRRTMENIKAHVEAAGGTMADVAQCLIYLTDPADFTEMNAVYSEYFSGTYPNRATVIVSALVIPQGKVEIVVYAHIGQGG